MRFPAGAFSAEQAESPCPKQTQRRSSNVSVSFTPPNLPALQATRAQVCHPPAPCPKPCTLLSLPGTKMLILRAVSVLCCFLRSRSGGGGMRSLCDRSWRASRQGLPRRDDSARRCRCYGRPEDRHFRDPAIGLTHLPPIDVAMNLLVQYPARYPTLVHTWQQSNYIPPPAAPH